MSNLPKNSAATNMVYGIVVGGHDADPAPDQSGGLRVYFPGLHGKNVQIEHLNFSPRIMSPTKGSQHEFPGGLDPGTLVVALKDTGSNYCQILGIANDTNGYDQRLAGNSDLLQFVNQFMSQNIGVRLPPEIYEDQVDGVRVRKIREKGFHNHNALRGLPTHGALYPLSGAPIPRVSGIATAKQPYDDLLTGDVLGSLPGVFMTLGKMFSLVQSTGLLRNITKNVPPEVAQAVGSIGNLIQAVETSEGAGFNVGGRVDQQTYLNNATSLLGQARNVSDVVSALSRLQTDSSLFGTDKLANGIIDSAINFGASKLSISPNGSIMRYLPKETRQAIQTTLKVLKLFNSVFPGQNLFGGSAEQMLKMLTRLTPKSAAFALLQLTKLNAGPQAFRFDNLNRNTVSGGNPFQQFF